MSDLVVHTVPVYGRPPFVWLQWDPGSSPLGSQFDRWRVFRQTIATPAAPIVEIASIEVGTGYTAATVEAQHAQFFDFDVPWAVDGADFEHGVRYYVTGRSAVTGIESPIASGVVEVSGLVEAVETSWLTCNAAPWLNTPVAVEGASRSSTSQENVRAYEAQGRDHFLTRTRRGIPGRIYRLDWTELGFPSERLLAGPRAAAISGRTFALHDCRGDHAHGTLLAPDTDRGGGLIASAGFLTTQGPGLADYNGPAGIVGDAAADYATVPDHNDLDPDSSGFAVFVCFSGAGSSGQFLLAKRTTGDGYSIRWSANDTIEAIADGTSTATLTEQNSEWSDGLPHVALLTSNGSQQRLYRDGLLVDADAVSHGAITNNHPLTVLARSDAANFSDDTVHAFGFYRRFLDLSEAVATCRYVLGFARARAAVDAECFVDFRDRRSWDGLASVARDIAGSGSPHDATLVSAPATRGYPWPLEELTAWRDR